jgi:dihydrofolate synthase/folylpolyglutamate synthase
MEAHHPRQIDLGLERVAAVAANLTLDLSGTAVITVGGTNGKGSCVAFLEAILLAQGYRVGTYTSPHLMRYNERVCIGGEPVDDAQLCAAFSAIEAALRGISLTYFEFGTLAALWLLQRATLDVIVLEVGLGGRLDAVNIIDADVAVLTTIDLDHQDWLGNDRETIGREKAGIFRAATPAICVDPQPPQTVSAYAQQIGALWYAVGSAFTFQAQTDSWDWSSSGLLRNAKYSALPLPALPLPSAAAAIAALHCLPLQLTEQAIRAGLRVATLPGRFQQLQWRGIEIILDVAHNPQAARWLALRLRQLSLQKVPLQTEAGSLQGTQPRRTHAVLAIMADKDVDGVIAPLQEFIDHWFIGDLTGNARALGAAELGAKIGAHSAASVTRKASLTQAFNAAVQQAQTGERIIVFGSFFTVAAVLTELQKDLIAQDQIKEKGIGDGR